MSFSPNKATKKQKIMRRAEGSYTTKNNQFGTKKENQFGTKKEKQFSQQEVKTKKPYRLNSPPIIISIVESAASVGLHVLNITLSRI